MIYRSRCYDKVICDTDNLESKMLKYENVKGKELNTYI